MYQKVYVSPVTKNADFLLVTLTERAYRRRTNKQEEYDEEMENCLAESHTTEKEGILEPGFIVFLSAEGIKGSDSTLHVKVKCKMYRKDCKYKL